MKPQTIVPRMPAASPPASARAMDARPHFDGRARRPLKMGSRPNGPRAGQTALSAASSRSVPVAKETQMKETLITEHGLARLSHLGRIAACERLGHGVATPWPGAFKRGHPAGVPLRRGRHVVR